MESGTSLTLAVSSVGYEPKQEQYQFSGKENAATAISIRLQTDTKQMEEVVVSSYNTGKITATVGGAVSVVRRTYYARVKDTLVQWARPAKVYPNPVQKGHSLALTYTSSLNNESMLIRLTGSNGQLIKEQRVNAVKGMNQFSLPVAGTGSSGVYFIQLINSRGKLVLNEKLMIQ